MTPTTPEAMEAARKALARIEDEAFESPEDAALALANDFENFSAKALAERETELENLRAEVARLNARR